MDPKQVSSRELIDCSIEQLIADINAKRKRDAALLEGMAIGLNCSGSNTTQCFLSCILEICSRTLILI